MIPKYQLQEIEPGLAGVLREHLGLGLSRPLTSLSEITDFARSRQMVSLWGGTELPSLQELATLELAVRKPLMASPVIAQVWAWTKELVDSQEFALLKLFRRHATLAARGLWSMLVDLAQGESQNHSRGPRLSTAAQQIAEFLAERGPLNTGQLAEALPRHYPILPESLRKGLEELEDRLVIYAKSLGDAQRGKFLPTWDLVRRGLAEDGCHAQLRPAQACIVQLVECSVHAAGIVDAPECSRWFPIWRLDSLQALGKLRSEGKLRALDDLKPSAIASPQLFANTTSMGCSNGQLHLTCN